MIKKKILLVDDDHDIRSQMSMYLISLGYSVVEAENEKEAVTIIEQGEFDAAVLDLMMENQDSGFILSHKIKRKFPNRPVIIVSAVTKETGLQFDSATPQEQKWIKADAFINKDLRFEQLKTVLDRFFWE